MLAQGSYAGLGSKLAAAMRFALSHKGITAAVSVVAAVAGLLFFSPAHPAPSIAVAAILCVIALASLADYVHTLNQRAAADGGSAWTVWVNDIEAASLSDAHYAHIRLMVYQDARYYVAQLVNIGAMLGNVLVSMLTVVPSITFWLVIAGLLIAPGDVGPASQYIVSDNHRLVQFLVAHMAVALGIGTFFGARFGARNVFEDAVRDQVRIAIGCSTQGRLLLTPQAIRASAGNG